jgi:hypothetical protein
MRILISLLLVFVSYTFLSNPVWAQNDICEEVWLVKYPYFCIEVVNRLIELPDRINKVFRPGEGFFPFNQRRLNLPPSGQCPSEWYFYSPWYYYDISLYYTYLCDLPWSTCSSESRRSQIDHEYMRKQGMCWECLRVFLWK